MAPKMPTLGPPPKQSPLPKVLVTALLIGGITGGIYWWKKRPADSDENTATATAAGSTGAFADAGANSGVSGAAPSGAVPGVAGADSPGALPPSPGSAPGTGMTAAASAAAQRGLRVATATINGPLETAVIEATDRTVGPALTQVVTRTLIWWVSVPGDLLRGDKLEVVFEERTAQEPLVHAVRFTSNKTGKTHEAYLFKSPTDLYARFYEPTGDELELRLKDSPMDDYEQITSLLRDGRRHKGVDFKAPEGSPVRATFDGVISRKNWNFRGNGNSLEITEHGGRRQALFLHLNELPKDLRVGARVRKGQVIAQSGNTGRSFAPHLHYQLMGGNSKVLDPFEQHATYRRSLASSDRAGFDAKRTELMQVLGGTAGTQRADAR